jgi:hypothetical protein
LCGRHRFRKRTCEIVGCSAATRVIESGTRDT